MFGGVWLEVVCGTVFGYQKLLSGEDFGVYMIWHIIRRFPGFYKLGFGGKEKGTTLRPGLWEAYIFSCNNTAVYWILYDLLFFYIHLNSVGGYFALLVLR